MPLNAPEALLDDYEQHPDRFKHRFGMTPTDFRKAKA